jgi:Polyketide cyclase / dehydrase and lipid transport
MGHDPPIGGCCRTRWGVSPDGPQNGGVGTAVVMPAEFAADSKATPDQAWALVAEPARWPEWAPHIRGAWGLGSPEVEEGRIGAARLFGIVPVPAKITSKTAGREWTWHVGPMDLEHAVHPTPVGSRITMTIRAPGPLEPLLAFTYGPIVQLLVRRLARVAAS